MSVGSVLLFVGSGMFFLHYCVFYSCYFIVCNLQMMSVGNSNIVQDCMGIQGRT